MRNASSNQVDVQLTVSLQCKFLHLLASIFIICRSVSAGFLQFLRLMATHNFLEEPIFVDINEKFNEQEKEDIEKLFWKRRPALPCICLSMPEDRAGIRYTTACPEPIVMCRLVKIARQTLEGINSSLKKLSPISYRVSCAFI